MRTTRGSIIGSIACMLAVVCVLTSVHRAVSAQAVPLLRETEEGIAITTPFFTALISPSNGGRVVSFRCDGVEMTRLSPDGHGGLFEERHTADFRFSVIELTRTETEAAVTLGADADGLRVIKQYMFRSDRPGFVVRVTLENRSAYPLAGSDGPALFSVLLPAGADVAGRHLYCMNRGAGAEVLTERVFLTSPVRAADGVLRWIAVADPASRRSVGLALQGNGAVLLPPRKTSDGALAFGWSCPPLPAGTSLTTEIAVTPFGEFSAIAELNRRFVVETLPASGPEPLPVRFDIMSLAEPLQAVSVITRAYGPDGRELEPCDPVLISRLEPWQPERAEIGRGEGTGTPATLLHEVYSGGSRIGAFHVPLGASTPRQPVPPEAPPEPQPIEGPLPGGPGAPPTVAEGAETRGFVLWEFEGRGPAREPEDLSITLGQGEQYTAFLGVRGLRDISRLRFTLAGAAGRRRTEAMAIPPGVAAVWQIEEGPDGAFMLPVRDMGLNAGELRWLAVSVDAGGVGPGLYSARLVADADGELWQLPLAVRVVKASRLKPEAFGIWYLPDAAASVDDQALAKLTEYGVSCVTVPESGALDETVDGVEERGFDMLAVSRGLGGLPPVRPAEGLLLVAQPSPVWQIRAGVAPSVTPMAAAAAGYATALSCERPETVPEEMLSAEHEYLAVLVDDGCTLGAISDLYADDRLSGDESIWLHLDIRGMSWQRAVTELRSAMWAAGWQGLAGVAVAAPPPAPQVDRQSVLWNVLRDARAEVARWRQTREAARAVRSDGETPVEQVRARAIIESTVGVAPGCDLRLAPVRRPFRELLRAAPPPDAERLSLKAFRAAHRSVLRAGESLPAESPDEQKASYWNGIPCAEGGNVMWAIAVGEGDAARERALAFQSAIEEATGQRVPASRALPRGGRRGPRLVWVVGGTSPPEGWPEAVREAARKVPLTGLAAVSTGGDAVVVVVGDDVKPERLVGTFRSSPVLYAPSRQVR